MGITYVDTIIFDIDKAGDKDVYLHLRAKDFVQNLIDNWQLDENTIAVARFTHQRLFSARRGVGTRIHRAGPKRQVPGLRHVCP